MMSKPIIDLDSPRSTVETHPQTKRARLDVIDLDSPCSHDRVGSTASTHAPCNRRAIIDLSAASIDPREQSDMKENTMRSVIVLSQTESEPGTPKDTSDSGVFRKTLVAAISRDPNPTSAVPSTSASSLCANSVVDTGRDGSRSSAVGTADKTRERLERCADIECFRTIRCEKTGKIVTEQVSIDLIESLAPVTVKVPAFPDEFANDFLQEFLQVQWHQGRRWLIDKEIVSHRLCAGFSFNRMKKQWERTGFADMLRHAKVILANSVRRLNVADPRSNVERLQRACGRQPLKTVKHLAKYLPSCMRGQWTPDFCVCNYYVNGDDFLGAHSDPLGSIGPYAIIAAVTFGGARQFRLKPVFEYKTSGGTLTSIGIRLPHNSLCIMWEGTQEFWRHEVPKDHKIVPHPLTGQGRLSFTFRQRAHRHMSRTPMCKCNARAVLKPVFKDNFNFGRYFWTCHAPRRKGAYVQCDFFQWDDDIS